jgi:hypothetical protein
MWLSSGNEDQGDLGEPCESALLTDLRSVGNGDGSPLVSFRTAGAGWPRKELLGGV